MDGLLRDCTKARRIIREVHPEICFWALAAMSSRDAAEQQTVRDIRRRTRNQYSAEEKVRIVLSGLRGEDSIVTALHLAAQDNANPAIVSVLLKETRP